VHGVMQKSRYEMKPNIVNILYFALGYLALSGAFQVFRVFEMENATVIGAIYNSSLSILITCAAAVSIFGLIKQLKWSRIIASGTISAQATLSIFGGVYMYFVNPEIGKAMLIVAVPISLALLFLAYKTYSSAELIGYLSNA
jgi:hypothetical protein